MACWHFDNCKAREEGLSEKALNIERINRIFLQNSIKVELEKVRLKS